MTIFADSDLQYNYHISELQTLRNETSMLMITIFLIHVSLNLCSLSDELTDLYEPEDQQLSVAPAVAQDLDSKGTKRKYTSPMTNDIKDPPKKMAGNNIVRTATASSTGVQTDVLKPKDAATQTISNICVDQPTSPFVSDYHKVSGSSIQQPMIVHLSEKLWISTTWIPWLRTR